LTSNLNVWRLEHSARSSEGHGQGQAQNRSTAVRTGHGYGIASAVKDRFFDLVLSEVLEDPRTDPTKAREHCVGIFRTYSIGPGKLWFALIQRHGFGILRLVPPGAPKRRMFFGYSAFNLDSVVSIKSWFY
jgi:hypothetical protein